METDNTTPRRESHTFGAQASTCRSARLLLAACAAAGMIAAVAAAAAPQQAPLSPQQRAQAPGYFRMPVGGLTVTALYDGHVDIQPSLLSGASETAIRSSLAQSFLPRSAPIQTAVNAYLVHTDKHTILVDTGTAKLFGPTLGFIPTNLDAAGYRPAQIDTVLLTHLHPDHAGGLLTEGGAMAFPNAQVFVSKADADYWLSEAEAARAPADKQALFRMSRAAIAPYAAAGRVTIFEAGQELREGVTAMFAGGHTPGHTAYLFASHGEGMLVWGDIVHNAAVQFPYPDVAIEFDWNKKQAVTTRRSVLAFARSRQLWVAGAHLPFPGIGHVTADAARGYRWVPAVYR